MGDDDARLRAVETAQAVHEAVCAARYKTIDLQLKVILGLLLGVLGAAAMGNPLIQALRAVF